MKEHISNLSGGNQQKVIVARWLANDPDVLIMDEPTRGIDVGAKHEIYEIMCDLAKQGKAIIMISSEMSELLGMSDRICVMCNGKLTGEVKEPEDMTQAKLWNTQQDSDAIGGDENGKDKTAESKRFLINNGVIIVMFILVIYTGLTSNNFFTGNNLMNILMNMSSRLVIALGIAGCVITAGCDLSAGRMIGFGACISGMLLQRLDYSGKFFPDMKPLNVVLVAIIAMLICAAFGTVTGIFIAYLNVPPFIATLAMMEIVYGIGLIVTNATPLGGYVEAYTNVANKNFSESTT